MKTNLKRVLSIFLILCLTLTMMPGLALTGFAYEEEVYEEEYYEEPYNYSFAPVFSGKSQQIFPNGSTLNVATELIAHYESYDKEITDFSLSVEVDSLDLLTYKVNQADKSVTFTANDNGETGWVQVIFSAYVDGELRGEYSTDIEVTNTIVCWPESFSEVNPEYRENPLVGEVIDLSDIEVEVSYYDSETGDITKNTYNKDSENIYFSISYDNAWEPIDGVTEEETLHPITRVSETDANVYLHLFCLEEGSYVALGYAHYVFEYLDYGVQWQDSLEAYDTQETADFVLDTNLLADKGDYKLVFTLGYYNGSDDEFSLVPFENQSSLYKVTESEGTATLTIYPSKIAKIVGDENPVVLVEVMAGDNVVNTMSNTIYLYEPYEEYYNYLSGTLFVGDVGEFSTEVEGYRENEQYPDGEDAYFEITDMKVIEGKDTVLSLEKDEWDCFCYEALDEGTAVIELTHEGFDGKTITSTHTLEVVTTVYSANIYAESLQDNIVPGGKHPLIMEVTRETLYKYEENIEVDVEWSVENDMYMDYVTFAFTGDDTRKVVVSVDENCPAEGENLRIVANAYDGDILAASETYEICITSDTYCIRVDNLDPYMEVGDSRTLEPTLRHIYLNDEGKYTDENVPAYNWDFLEVYDEELGVTDNGDGTFEVVRLYPYSISFGISCYDEATDTEHALYADYFYGLDYNVGLQIEGSEEDVIYEGGTVTAYLEDENLNDKQLASVEWAVGQYEYNEETDEDYIVDYPDGYTVAEDGRSIEIDGTAMYESGYDYIHVVAYIYSGKGDHKVLVNEAQYGLQVCQSNGDDAGDLNTPENFVISYTPGVEKVVLEWDRVENAVGYEVQKSDSEAGDYSTYMFIDSNTFIDNDVEIGKTYYYRVRAYNDYTESGWEPAAITCRLPAPKAVGIGYDSETEQSMVTWDAVPSADEYDIFRSTFEDGGYEYIDSTTNTYFVDRDIEAGETYYYKIRSYCLSNETAYSELSECTGITYDIAKPTNVKIAPVVKTGKINVTWDAVPGASKYELWRKVGSNGKYQKYDTTTGTSYTNNATTPGTIYYYRVRAIGGVNGDAKSELSKEVYMACDLAQPQNVKVAPVVETGKPRVTWDAVEGATKYEVWRKAGSSEEYVKYYTTADTYMANTSTTPGTIYYYKVLAVCGSNVGGNSALSKEVYMACDLPQPQNVKVAPVVETGKPKVTWDAVEGATKYEVWRKAGSSGEYVKYYTTADTYMTNTSTTPGTIYYYKVKAICGANSGGNSAFSKEVYMACDLPQPQNVKVAPVVKTGKINVTWDAVPGASKYELWRKAGSSGTYQKYDTITGTSYTNNATTPGTIYYYKVKAVCGSNSGGNSAFSKEVYMACDLPQPQNVKVAPVVETGKPKVTWDAVEGATKYEVWRKAGSSGEYVKYYTTTSTYMTNTSTTPGTIYYYKVKAICGANSGGNSAFSDVVYMACDLAQPKASIALTSAGKPKVSWGAVEGASKYEVYRAVGPNGTYEKYYTTTGTSMTNTSAVKGTTYYYKVKAICGSNSGGNSALSNKVYITSK